MDETKTLADYMKEYYSMPTQPAADTLSDGMKKFFDDMKTSIPLSSVGAPQADPYAGYKPGAPQPEIP